jgi:tRNA (cmo5U34)-methyltransferase
MKQEHNSELLFQGPIADEYDMLKLICPSAVEMSRKVGEFIGDWTPLYPYTYLNLLEIGCGTGITTAHLLACRDHIEIVSVDNAPAMLSQSRQNLAQVLEEGRLHLIENDALSYLQGISNGSVDIIASAYALHNFLNGYRCRVLEEIFRALKPGGLFINGDRYCRAALTVPGDFPKHSDCPDQYAITSP